MNFRKRLRSCAAERTSVLPFWGPLVSLALDDPCSRGAYQLTSGESMVSSVAKIRFSAPRLWNSSESMKSWDSMRISLTSISSDSLSEVLEDDP